jgi:SAM-dependent methyltransferase
MANSMANPWLNVPLADYEGHMSADGVEQLEALAELFAEALAHCLPESVLVIGIAGGNGLDRIDSSVTRRVVGIDINPAYLAAVRERYGHTPGLELICADLTEPMVACPPAQLVHAALVFEHAGAGPCLDHALSLVADDSWLSVVLQLPSDTVPGVTKGQFASIETLCAGFIMIDPATLRGMIETRGYRIVRERHRALPAGKAFWTGLFARNR